MLPPPSMEVFPEDQYVRIEACQSLQSLHQSLPENLHYRAPLLELSIGDWVRSGGFGQLRADPVRRDVLGLEYRSLHQANAAIAVGGVVVKNVSGYDLVRLLVASDPSLQREQILKTLHLRLRPRPLIVRQERSSDQAGVPGLLEQLRQAGAAFGFAYQAEPGGVWQVQGEWWDDQPEWGESNQNVVPVGVRIIDEGGDFPRMARPSSGLEQRLLEAL